MTLQEIYNALFAGKKLQLEFSTHKEMQDFRVQLHQVKLANERPAVDVGIMKEEERQQLNFTVDDMFLKERGSIRVDLHLTDKIPKKQYEVRILEE